MNNRSSVPGPLPSIKTTLSSERPLSFSDFEKDVVRTGVFEDTKDQPHHLIITSKHDSNKPKITSKLKNNNNNKNNSNNKSKLLKIKSKSSSSSSSTNANLSIATNKSLSQDDDENEDFSDVIRDSITLQESKVIGKNKGKSYQKSVGMSNSRDWEILEGLKSGQSFNTVPPKHEGFMMKSRKWPMKGWHKRYFSLKNGFLIYAKSPSDIEKGKSHGHVDVGLSVIVCKQRGFRIDMDADDTIYHLKTKTHNDFEDWKRHLRDHRLFRQNAISTGCENQLAYDDDAPSALITTSAVAALASATKRSSIDVVVQAACITNNHSAFDGAESESFLEGVKDLEISTDTAAALENNDLMEKKKVLLTSDELNEVQLKLCDLGMLLSDIQNFTTTQACSTPNNTSQTKKEKSKTHIRLKKDKRNKDLLVPEVNPALVKCSSNPSLALNEETPNGVATGFHASPTAPVFKEAPMRGVESLCVQFYQQAEYILSKLDKVNHQMMSNERSRNKLTYSSDYVQKLKMMMAELKKQNSDLRGKLDRIHNESTMIDAVDSIAMPLEVTNHKTPSVDSSESLDSANNQFYDAPDQLEPSSEGSEDDEEEDENSDTETKLNEECDANMEERFSRFQMRRRSRLPSPSNSSDLSIWALLRKNIGKDLSKISMPVVMNEPLNALQRLCEEMEYSELLERAVEVQDPYERMVWVAVFTVSTYANTFTRAARKPFNPLLGETYESDRTEKGWRFLAEQVSHHPPVSASYCESKDFDMWQDMQVKTKFWGKSMEVQPIGTVNLLLKRHKEEYTWNKATSCIHNILGGQRWVEHYGEVVVTNHTRGIICKLNYVKSSYFSAKKYEVYGQVFGGDDVVLHHLFGRWNESMFHGQSESTAKCIWRPGALPPDHHLYYGFTKFAMELNEVEIDQVNNYPCTDTRFRPDQRLLEMGRVEEAEMEKRRVEQKQRDMRNQASFNQGLCQPTWFIRRQDDSGKDIYTYNGQYWNKRKNPGFNNINLPTLW